MTLHLRCNKCNFLDIIKYENGKKWKCPNCEYSQPERSKREDINHNFECVKCNFKGTQFRNSFDGKITCPECLMINDAVL